MSRDLLFAALSLGKRTMQPNTRVFGGGAPLPAVVNRRNQRATAVRTSGESVFPSECQKTEKGLTFVLVFGPPAQSPWERQAQNKRSLLNGYQKIWRRFCDAVPLRIIPTALLADS